MMIIIMTTIVIKTSPKYFGLSRSSGWKEEVSWPSLGESEIGSALQVNKTNSSSYSNH